MTYPWHSPRNVVHDIVPTGPIGSDICYKGAIDLSAEIARLRARLLPSENERFRLLGQDCASAMMKTIYMVKPGMTEFEIASKMSESCMSLGIQSIVNLVATDERIFLYRHPLPTNKKLGNYMMLVLSGRREGLVCSMTRLVSFGSLSAEIKEKSRSVATIDAVLIAETRPGITLSQIVQRGITMYADSGYPDEWAQHHQGGVTGYEPREYLATPTSTDVVDLGQAFAWNPSISGAKSEDTILVGQHRNEIITDMSDWPIIQINTGMGIVNRPGILEID
jgi:antitoxin VapB